MFMTASEAKSKSEKYNQKNKLNNIREAKKCIRSIKSDIKYAIKQGKNSVSYIRTRSVSFYDPIRKYYENLGYTVKLIYGMYSDQFEISW